MYDVSCTMYVNPYEKTSEVLKTSEVFFARKTGVHRTANIIPQNQNYKGKFEPKLKP